MPASLTGSHDSLKPLEIKKFFVLKKWSTSNRDKALSHMAKEHKQLMTPWKQGAVENVYCQPDGKFEFGKPASLVAFVINGLSENDVRRALVTTELIKNNLATYIIIPVGERLFGRDDNPLKRASVENSYAVIWAFLVEKNKLNSASLEAQSLINKQLNEQGVLENAYINLKLYSGDSSRIQPAFFFINAKSEQDAKAFLDKMPLVISKQATYSLHSVGSLLFGAQD
jgi:hypothetical protein